jgi:hypothetical protein
MKKQGRPRFDDNLIEQVKARFPDVHSRRGQQNLTYLVNAYNILKDVNGIDFLWTYDELGNWTGMKRKIVTELGRFGDAKTIKGVAIRLCADQKHTPRSVEKWAKKLREVRLQNKTSAFLNGQLSLIPFLVIQNFPCPGFGLVKTGKIIELPIGERSHIAAPIRGELPETWRQIAFLADNCAGKGADNGVLVYRDEHWVLSKTDSYIALYRTAEEFFKVVLEPGAPYAQATILGRDLQKPSNEVLRLYNNVLPNTHNLRLRPMTGKDRGIERAAIRTNFEAREYEKAMQERENYDPLNNWL